MRRIGGSVRVVARLGVIASILALASVLATCVVGVPAFGAVRFGGILGSPLVVPSAESFLGGQQQAADEAARRANPAAVAARLRSRTAFAHRPGAQVGGLLGKAFPGAIHHPAGGTPPLPSGAHVVGYPSAHAIQLSLPGHQIGILESTAPVAKRSSHGHFKPINLALTATGSGFAPANSDVTVTIPRALSSGVGTPQNGVTLTPVDPRGRGFAARGGVVGSSVVYPNTQSATDTVVKPTPTGFQLDAVLRSIDSPQQLYFRVGAPAGAKLVQDAASGVVRVLLKGATLATILPPGATDAAGTTVPASMSVVGHTVVVSVEHRTGSYLYPIYVDPEINDSQLVEVTGGKRSNWEFKSSNEAKFGHKAVYEGPGKERLEASGTAEYAATEFAYWAYETKGNSKIYELKTKTSAKNKLAKIESFLEFRYSGGAESKKLLSTELEEPEYTEKASTICAWNASKVEECLPASGKEKNVVRFQQSATASPGANFKFLDTMSEGIVSISEPAEEHSTTMFNTTAPEVEGEVEGKMQKRTNALYGSGIWLTKSMGALQLIAKDPGIGVSATRLEYEKSAGSWETLSSHNYLETEHACQGVQCYAEHAEYWTADPKLPDGEDKIRYRAEEAISGTVSPAAEEASTKTVRVNTAKPHGVYLSGLPYGNELSEKPYALTAGAIDGVGSTVASSGIKSIAFYIEGSLIGINGGTGGGEGTEGKCSVAKGECGATAKWSINGAELGAGHHAIVIVATDNAGNEERIEETISIRHSTPVAIGPGSVDLQSGDFALGASDVAMGSGLNVARNYSSRDLSAGDEGPLGPQWSLNLGTTESLIEMVDHSVMLTDAKGEQVIFAALEGGGFEAPVGDSNLTLKLEENEAKVKLAYYLEDATKHTKTKFTLPSGGSKTWLPSKQEGTVATDTVSYTFQTVESRPEFPLTSGFEHQPLGIAAGPDGNLWIADFYHIGKMTRAGAITEYSLPSGGGWAESITTGSDGNLWFTTATNVGKITTTGTVTEYALPAEGDAAEGMTAGPDGNVWFTGYTHSKIGKITPTGTITQYSLPAGSHPRDITSGSDGNLWFTEEKKIGKITTSGTITEYTLPEWGKWPNRIVSGPDGNLWFTNIFGEDRIGKITTSGTVTGYSPPTGSEPTGIASGPDGNVWFVETKNNKVGKITKTGTFTEYAIPSESEPKRIVAGADGKLWFTNLGPKRIGTITTSGGIVTEPTEVLAPVPAGVSCSPMKRGCRALRFEYSGSTSAGENMSEWGSYKGHLLTVVMEAYDPVSKEMQTNEVAEYRYDKLGRLRKVWDPRISPTLATTYGYDEEGHVTALSSPGMEPWAFTYGTTPGDSGTGRLVKVARAEASETLWGGEAVKNTEAPTITGSPAVGVRMAVSNGKWSNSPFTYGYQWERCDASGAACTPIPGANNANYKPVTADVGHKLVAFVTATSGGGSVAAVSAASGEVEAEAHEGFTEGASRTPMVGYTVEYAVPLSGTGLPTMTSGEVAKWGQTDDPVEATAVLPPDAVQGWPASSYTRASIYYVDSHGRTVNARSPSTATYGSIATTEYNEMNDPVRALSPDNRQTALEAGSKSVEVSKLLDTQSKYSGESEEPGTQLIETLGPQHQVKYMAGSEQKESLARLHTKYFYNESAPSGTFNLVTKVTTLAQLANEEEVEVRKTTTSYSGQSNLGWTLRAPTSVTVDPEGAKLTTTTLYNSTTGQITETRAPAGSGGESAHDMKSIYYTAAENTEGYAGCGSHAEWAGLVCVTVPAKQPSTGPELPATNTTYNIWNEPETTTETFGSTVRRKEQVYDEAGRLTESQTLVEGEGEGEEVRALPNVVYEYNSKTGLLEKRSTTSEGGTKTITSMYDTLGNLTEYTDADGNKTNYIYGSAEKDGLLEQTTDEYPWTWDVTYYYYNATTKLRDNQFDFYLGWIQASYDAEGRMTSEIYPNGMCANSTYNSVGEATHIEYIATSTCTNHAAPVWYSETRKPSVRGETFSRASTLSSEAYAYDAVGRLTETQETPAGKGCSVRLYGYDEESNRTSQTTRTPGTGGKCATEGGTVQTHTYDEGNRLSDAGVAYDSFGNMTKVPAADAEGHELSSTFYVDNAVATQNQNGVTHEYELDPEGRIRETHAEGEEPEEGTIAHYDGPGEGVAWTSDIKGGPEAGQRNIAGLDGTLVATQRGSGMPVLQLHDLQGDIVATAELHGGLLSTYNSTEFGVPNAEKAPPKFAWLGASGIASSLPSGVITYGATSYVPQIGRSLQSEAVDPPGAPGGTGAGAQYNSQLEPWVFQGAAAEAAEAPGLEAARELAAQVAALTAAAAAGGEDPTYYMNQKRAIWLGEKLNKVDNWGEVWDVVFGVMGLADPAAWLEGAVVSAFSLDVMKEWLHNTGGKLEQCGKKTAKWISLCKLKYNTILNDQFINPFVTSEVDKCGTYTWYDKHLFKMAWECRRLNEAAGPV